jgi:hypothetical protein
MFQVALLHKYERIFTGSQNMNHKTKQAWLLILFTPFFFYIAHALAFFIHEYSHSFAAWLFGFKANPLLLNFGDTSWGNILFFTKIDENVDFNLFSASHPWIAAFVAFAGMAVGNFILFFVAVKALLTKKHHHQLYYYCFIWLATMNLGNFNDYIPGRTFTTHGDIGEITHFLNISPWYMMILFGYPICYCFWFFYSKVLPYTYKKLAFNPIQQIILLVMITFTLFALFGAVGYSDYGPDSRLIALLSIYMTPIVIVACWPLRKWVSKDYF